MIIIVFTESKLFKAKPATSDLCYLYLKTKQDLKHMLVSCPVVSEFWKTFLEWYDTLTAIKLELSTVKILYGIIENDRYCRLINHLLLIAKYYIYCCSINKEPLYFCTHLKIAISIGGKNFVGWEGGGGLNIICPNETCWSQMHKMTLSWHQVFFAIPWEHGRSK